MGDWMKGDKPTLEEKIKFGHDASDAHLYWADYLKEHPEQAGSIYLRDIDFQEECATLHEETALELEQIAKQEGGQRSGCLIPFGKLKGG